MPDDIPEVSLPQARPDPQDPQALPPADPPLDSTAEVLKFYVVYDHPTDFPSVYAVRKHTLHKSGKVVPCPQLTMMSRDLEAIRWALGGQGLNNMGRYPDDDPSILEVWV